MIRRFVEAVENGSAKVVLWGSGSPKRELSQGISEALYNTALGIGTSAVAIIMYNVFTTRIDGITYGIDESGFTLTQSFAANYK
jgi:biopolymer transport protein ExbB